MARRGHAHAAREHDVQLPHGVLDEGRPDVALGAGDEGAGAGEIGEQAALEGLRAAEETCFYDRMNADHAAFAAHLLDPSERALVDAATATSRKIGKIELATSACATTVLPSLIALSRDAAHDLDAFVSGPLPAARSLIHPVLGAHVLREGRRALAVLDRMAAA